MMDFCWKFTWMYLISLSLSLYISIYIYTLHLDVLRGLVPHSKDCATEIVGGLAKNLAETT